VNLPSLLPALLPAATLVGAWYVVRPGALARVAAEPENDAAEPTGPAAPAGGVVAPIRLGLIRAAVVVAAYATVGIEVLSAFHAVTRAGIIALWVVGLLAAGAGGPLEWISPASFAAANLIVGLLVLKTLGLLLRGRLLPAATPSR